MRIKKYALLWMTAAVTSLAPLTYAQGPVFVVTPVSSTIKFNVKASVPIDRQLR